MAYSSPTTRATGYVVLATNWNEFVNNFIAMAPDVFTTDGDLYVASGADAGVRIAAFTGSTGTLKHEVGGIEADISAVAAGGLVRGTGTGSMGLLGIGTGSQFLKVNSGATDLEWATGPFKSTVARESRTAAAASGDVSYTGAGFTPVAVIIFAVNEDADDSFSWGFGDDAVAEAEARVYTVASSPVSSTDTDNIISIVDPAGTDSQAGVLKTLDADGITLTWTKGTNGEQLTFIILYLG